MRKYKTAINIATAYRNALSKKSILNILITKYDFKQKN